MTSFKIGTPRTSWGLSRTKRETVTLEERTRRDRDLGVKANQVGPSGLSEEWIHDLRHVTLAGMIGRHVPTVNVPVGIELHESRDRLIDNGHPGLLSLTSPAPFIRPRTLSRD